jgi:hypothetical protein
VDIYVAHLVRFLGCVFFGVGDWCLCCSSCKFSVLCFGDVYIAHLVSFLCYVFLGVMDVYFAHPVSFLCCVFFGGWGEGGCLCCSSC